MDSKELTTLINGVFDTATDTKSTILNRGAVKVPRPLSDISFYSAKSIKKITGQTVKELFYDLPGWVFFEHFIQHSVNQKKKIIKNTGDDVLKYSISMDWQKMCVLAGCRNKDDKENFWLTLNNLRNQDIEYYDPKDPKGKNIKVTRLIFLEYTKGNTEINKNTGVEKLYKKNIFIKINSLLLEGAAGGFFQRPINYIDQVTLLYQTFTENHSFLSEICKTYNLNEKQSLPAYVDFLRFNFLNDKLESHIRAALNGQKNDVIISTIKMSIKEYAKITGDNLILRLNGKTEIKYERLELSLILWCYIASILFGLREQKIKLLNIRYDDPKKKIIEIDFELKKPLQKVKYITGKPA